MRKPVELSEQTKIRASRMVEIYKAGRLFTKQKTIMKTCEVFLAANDFADSCGMDVAKVCAAEEGVNCDVGGATSYEIVHNFVVILRNRVSPYYCAVAVYDFDQGVCEYLGISQC